MTDFIYLYASFGMILTLVTCYGFICHCIDFEKYKRFEESDDIEYEFEENILNQRNNNDFIP